MHAVIFGASRGIGYHTTIALLSSSSEWTCTLLLRTPSKLDADPKLKPFLEEGRVKLVQGNATNEADVRKVFTKNVDLVVTSVGGVPKITLWGIENDQPVVCTQSALALLRVLASLSEPLPRVIAISSMGIGNNHHIMPLALRILYPLFAHKPHLDKEGLEALLHRASIIKPNTPLRLPPRNILSSEDFDSIKQNFLPEVIIVRPALLLGEDKPALGKETTKVGEEIYTYSVRRSEVGRFVAEECLPGQDEWVGKMPVVGY